MAYVSIILFWFIILLLCFYIFRQKEGHYKFSFFFILVTILYLGVQLLIFNDLEGDDYVYEISAYVIYTLLVNAAVIFGFRVGEKGKISPNNIKIVVLNTKLPFILLLVIVLLAFYSYLKLSTMMGGINAMYNGGANDVVWEGATVKYTFAIQNLYFVIPISLFLWKRLGMSSFLILAVLSSLIPLANAILLNRRFALFLLATTIYLFLYFQCNFKLKKIFMVILAPAGMAVVTLFPLLRSEYSFDQALDKSGLSGINMLIGNSYGEVKNATLGLAASITDMNNNFALGFIKQIFKDFVPSSIIGRDLKTEILGSDNLRQIVVDTYNYYIPSHEFVTGITTSYYELGMFALALWCAIGYFFGKQWAKAKLGDLKCQVMYTAMIPAGLMALYYSPTAALSQAIKVYIVVNLCFILSRVKANK